MGRYAKIIADTGEVLDVQDHPIQLLDEERGVFDVVELDLEPIDGLRPGDHVERRYQPTAEDRAAFEAALEEDDLPLSSSYPEPEWSEPSTAVPEADEATSDEHEPDTPEEPEPKPAA